MTTRKEMIQRYKEMKTHMGVYRIKNNVNGKVYIDVSTDTKSMFNRIKFQLKAGAHRVKELQRDWKEYGEEVFVFEVLEYLEYDEEGNKDYREDLEILKMIWLEKLKEEGILQIYS